MGKKSRRKGYKGEYELVNLFNEFGLSAKRVPLSGATTFQKGDILVNKRVGEVKLRKDGFKTIYNYLGKNDFLAIKADRKSYLIVLPVMDFIELLRKEAAFHGYPVERDR